MSLKNLMSARTDFSIGESMLQVEHLIADAKEKGYESVTLMDTMSIHALVDFTNRCIKAELKPIIGCRIRVVQDPTYRKPAKSSGEKEKPNPAYFIKAYVQNEQGVKSLLKLLSKANSEEYFYYHARVSLDDVMSLEGVAISTGDLFSVWHLSNAQDIVDRLSSKFQTYIELVPINTPLFDTLNAKALSYLAESEGSKSLVTYPIFYRQEDHADTLGVLKCITSNGKMSDGWRPIQYVKDFYIHEPLHLLERVKLAASRAVTINGVTNFKEFAIGVKNIQALVNSCEYQFRKQPISLPKMAEDEFAELTKKCVAGWKARLSEEVLGYKPSAELTPVYKERLQYELSVLKEMGFSNYFLLVEDLVTWAKKNGIFVGCGRGSVGGSLVAYLIGITDVDPIRFNLIFERFINPERSDLPDADLDFMSSKRHLIAEYLSEKYGEDRVAGISNYSTLASASALRDTGRVYGLGGLDLVATKLVPKEHGKSFTLTESARLVPDLEKFRDSHTEIWNHALKLEGAMRAFGRHAAGVVVAGEPLTERAVTETRSETSVVSWDKRVVEDWGLVKMDILGLSTLDVLDIARTLIQERHGIHVDYLKVPLDDAKVMEAFGRGDSSGIFQFDSLGMKKLLKDLSEKEKLTFEDITAATALYRPGPMDSGLMDDYVAIKQGLRLPSYDHPNMKSALEQTSGVIVYQEQVMQVAVDLAGFTKAESDNLRKIMGKKDKEKMAEVRQKWIDGCAKKSSMDARHAGDIFDRVEAFAGYGFNRSHAVSYSIVSYWTMWARVNYPAEYFAACMSVVDEEKLPSLVKDARECGIEVLPPDINLSTERFSIPDDTHILAPFSSVKGVSENTALQIVKLRKSNKPWVKTSEKKKRDGTVEEVWQMEVGSPVTGRFKSAQEFILAASQVGSKVNARVVENLRLVGALASIDPDEKPARDLSRRKDQMELMSGLIIDAVKADRVTDLGEKFLRAKVISLIQDYKKCDGCSLREVPHPSVRAKTNVKFMVVSDCPTWQEEKADKLLEGDSAEFVKLAIKNAGLMVAEGYYTTLVKARKTDKFLTNEQVNSCAHYLDKELELIKPSVIIALGSASIKRFVPGLKGGPADMAGKSIYDPILDATIVCGINAQQISFDPDKQAVLNQTFAQVAEILS